MLHCHYVDSKAITVINQPMQRSHFVQTDWLLFSLFLFLHPFFSLRGDVDVSAVCQYQIGEVKNVFDGPYKDYRESSQRWVRYTGAVPSPRPGAVS